MIKGFTTFSKGHIAGKRGFTLIELLVVIAIIGILAGIVLASLGTARTKGTSAKIQEQLSSIRTAAEIYYGNNNNTYAGANGSQTGLCTAASGGSTMWTDPLLASLITSTSASATAIDCGDSNTAWAVSVTLPSGGYWCVDSTGASRGATINNLTYASLIGTVAAGGTKIAAGQTSCN